MSRKPGAVHCKGNHEKYKKPPRFPYFFFAFVALNACAGADGEHPTLEQNKEELKAAPGTWRPPPIPASAERDPLAGLEEVREHSADPWVNCRALTREVATDPLGPVVSHGFLEAPGYQRGVIDVAQARFLRRNRLRFLPISEGFFMEDVVLPSAQEPREAILHAVTGALRIAGWSNSGDVAVAFVQERPRRDGLHEQREWWISFAHQGIPLQGHYCRLQVATVGEAFGALACWLPRQPVSNFESFRVSQQQAEESAKIALDFRRGRVLSKQSYQVGQSSRERVPVGLARTAVILYDGQAEWQVVVDGEGQVVSRTRTELGFQFLGYPLDYQEGLQSVEATIGVHPTQQDFLDSAPKIDGAANCVLVDGPGNDPPMLATPYQFGMVVCDNGAWSDFYKPESDYNPPRTMPRADADHTNQPDGFDPFGFQQIALHSVPGSTFVAPAFPIELSSPEGLVWRGVHPSLKQVAPAGWAELQAFHSLRKRASFYKFFPQFGPSSQGNFGPRTRLEIFVHQRQGKANNEPVPSTIANLTALNSIRFGDLHGSGAEPAIGGKHFFEALADGSIVAHEFHHHIQLVNELALRGTLVNSDPNEDFASAEGMADLFGAVAAGRPNVGLLAKPTLQDPCLNEDFPPISPTTPTRSACNNNVFPSAGNRYERGAALFGAGYNYAKRLLDSGLGPASALFDMYDAETLFLATPVETAAGQPLFCEAGTPCGLRRMLEGLILSLRYSDPSSVQPGESANTPLSIRRRQQLALSAFAAKGMFLTANNIKSCGPAPCPSSTGTPKEIALRTLAVSSASRWKEGDRTPFFEVFAPGGTAYEHSDEPDPTSEDPNNTRVATRVTFEFAQDALFSNPLNFQKAAPKPRNNSPAGSFRFRPTDQQWQILQLAGAASAERRLYYRVKVCLDDAPTECIYSTDGISQGVTSFIQFGPGAPPDGCACRVGQAGNEPWIPLSLSGVLGVAFLRRRRKA